MRLTMPPLPRSDLGPVSCSAKKSSKALGWILLKGDTIALMQTANPGE